MAAQTLKLERSDIQGLVARGYGRLKEARFILLRVEEPKRACAWLLDVAASITSAVDDAERAAVNIAFTARGLSKLGLPSKTMRGFSLEFREGMMSAHRSRVLGDRGNSAPERWRWGGHANPDVDIILLLYAVEESALDESLSLVAGGGKGIDEVAVLSTVSLTDREHFGWHDGISQPSIEGLMCSQSAADTVAAGEFLLGYPNEYGLMGDGPVLDPEADPDRILPHHLGGADFGRNGSYLVVRHITQDVPGFWRYMTAAGDGDHDEAVRLASKMIGRWPSGAPLVASPERDEPALGNDNDFGYHRIDPHGLACPKGSHVRRAHPRDSLDPNPGTGKSLEISRRHRILRRGRQFGSWTSPIIPFSKTLEDDGERGLYFMCLNANLARQFEFIQHTWINNPKFDGLYEDMDPVVATASTTFTAPAMPLRRRVTGVPGFVTVRGGAYFFLPGIRALRYLASLR